MGSQTNGKAPALRYVTVGNDLFDHPSWDGLTLAHAGLWLYLNVEACKHRGRVSLVQVKRASSMGGSPGRVSLMFAALVDAGLFVDVGGGWYEVAGWSKYQTDYPYRRPSDKPEARAERKRRSRSGTGGSRAGHEYVTDESRQEGEGEGEEEEEGSTAAPKTEGGPAPLWTREGNYHD